MKEFNTIDPLQLPLFELESKWRPPAAIIERTPMIGVDLETRDTDLKTRGPGFKYGQGEIVGVSLANELGEYMYLPFAHQGGDNLDKHLVRRIVSDFVLNAGELIMANADYDLGWLLEWGLPMPCGKIRDIQIAEALIDEELKSYSLDSISERRLGFNKNEKLLRQAAQHYGIDPKAEMWKLPARYVGTYAEQDALLTMKNYQQQIPELKKLGLWAIWELESDIVKICSKMTRKGIKVDLDAASQLNDELESEEQELQLALRGVNVNSADHVAKFLEREHQVKVPKLETGNYSIKDQWLSELELPDADNILRLRQLMRLRKTFIEENILNGHYKGRIHASFRQTTSEEGGTRSGRFSSNNPNMQQVPSRSEIGKRIRQLYVAEDGMFWAKGDYSSQEPGIQIHYGLELGLKGAHEAAEAYQSGVKLYTFLEKETGLPYATCKMLVLGIGYGMGKATMADKLGISIDECEGIRDTFKQKVPYLSQLFDRCKAKAEESGFIRTILGRRSNFDYWALDYESEKIKGYENALKKFGRPPKERCFTANAMNRLVQGSAADQTKKAMTICDQEGIDLRLPVHDENNAVVENEEQANKMKEIMENALKFRVKIPVDLDFGKTWK